MTRAWLAAALLAACTEMPTDEARSAPVGPCAAVTEEVADEPGVHYPIDTALTWSSTPPASGAHYWTWARWDRSYDAAVPPGFWLHNAEHGGVVLLHRGDTELRRGLEALTASLPVDPRCAAPLRHRTLITPGELADGVEVAAVAWTWRYTARCLDAGSLRAFVEAHYGRASESTCADGLYPDGL